MADTGWPWPIPAEMVKRPVIVDGCNVICLLGRHVNSMPNMNARVFDPSCLLLLVHELLAADYEVLIVLKQYYDNPRNVMGSHHFIIQYLKLIGIIEVLPDDVDDDAYILERAEATGAAVISNDRYTQPKYQRFREARKRLLSISFCRVESFTYIEASSDRSQRFNFNLRLTLHCGHPRTHYSKPGYSDYERIRQKREETADQRARQLRFTEIAGDFLQQRLAHYGSPQCRPPRLAYFSPRMQALTSFKKFLQSYGVCLEQLIQNTQREEAVE
ncbi:hypothetical protein M3Y99_01507600 [Aphelenchoides fujianensis]|nr:hypothetical protein M3Y99_01507600 [Aphelenchoides fujianensis]